MARGSWGPPLNLVKSVDTVTYLWDEAYRLAAQGVIAVIISSCCIWTTQPPLAISAAGWCTHLQKDRPGLWWVVAPASLPQIPSVLQSWKSRSGHSLAKRGICFSRGEKKPFRFKNLHLNQFINPKGQIRRRERRKGRCEEFRESRTKIALLNTSFLFWTFSQWLLNLTRFIEKKKVYILYSSFMYSLLEDNLVECCCMEELQLQLSHPQVWDLSTTPSWHVLSVAPRNRSASEAPVSPAK